MDIAPWANLAVCQSEDLEVPREKHRAGDNRNIDGKTLRGMYSAEATELLKLWEDHVSVRKKKHENNTEGEEAGVRWEIQLQRVKDYELILKAKP